MKQLVEQRNALLKEYDALQEKLKTEKRFVTNEERTRSNEILIALQEIDSQMETQKGIEAMRNKKIDAIVERNEVLFNANKEENEVRTSGLEAFLERRSGSYTMKAKDFFGLNKRSTITTSSDPAFIQANTHNDILVDAGETPLVALAKPQFLPKGTLKVPMTKGLVGQFVAEGGSASDADPQSSYVVLSPTYIVTPIPVSDAFLYSTTDELLNKIVADGTAGLYRAIEKRAYDSQLSGVTSATGTSFQKVVNAEGLVNVSNGSYILSNKATAKAKFTSTDAGSGQMIWNGISNTVNGLPSYRGYLIGDNFKGYYGDFAGGCVIGLWDEVKIEFVKDSTLAKAGETLIVISIMGDVKIDPSRFAQFTI